MAVWPNEQTMLTQKGLNLQAKLMTGAVLRITRAEAGAGFVDPSALKAQTAVRDPRQELSLGAPVFLGEGQIKLLVQIANMELSEGYTNWQIGVYAEDPDEGEILYLLSQASEPDPIPAHDQQPGVVVDHEYYIDYSNAEHVAIQVNPSALVTQGQLIAYGNVPFVHKKIGTVHELKGPEDAKHLAFSAAASFADGDTFSVNGKTVEAKTLDGQSLHSGDFIAGQEVTASISDGRLFFHWRSYYNEISSNSAARHAHENKGVIDKVTQALLDKWNAAYTHISDAVKHITASERNAWNAKADKSYVDTSLENKANVGTVLPVVSSLVTPAAGLDANNFVMGKMYCTSTAAETATVTHRPLEAEGVNLSSSTIFTLPSNAARDADSNNWCIQFWIARYQLRTFFRHKDGTINGWGKWVEFATATPPKEFDLPLAAGFTHQHQCKYFRSQENIVTLNIAIKATRALPSGTLIATLPLGYRPSAAVEAPASLKLPNVAASVVIHSNGEIKIFGATIAENQQFYAGSSFVAS